jgi:hypothetical protein
MTVPAKENRHFPGMRFWDAEECNALAALDEPFALLETVGHCAVKVSDQNQAGKESKQEHGSDHETDPTGCGLQRRSCTDLVEPLCFFCIGRLGVQRL